MLLTGLGVSSRRRTTGGGAAVALSDLDSIIASFSNGPGYLRDFRMADGLFQDTGDTTATAVDGDPVGSANNQSTGTGAGSHDLDEATTSIKPEWYDGVGITSNTNSNFVRMDDTFVSLTGTRFDSLTTMFAVKASISTSELTSRVIGSQSSYYNVSLRALGDGTHAIQPYLSQSLGDIAVTGDANDVMVIITQWAAGPVLNVYANNVLIGSPSLAGVAWLAGQQANFNFGGYATPDKTAEFVLGWSIIPGLMDSDQRQTFCDYFQQNAGVL